MHFPGYRQNVQVRGIHSQFGKQNVLENKTLKVGTHDKTSNTTNSDNY